METRIGVPLSATLAAETCQQIHAQNCLVLLVVL